MTKDQYLYFYPKIDTMTSDELTELGYAIRQSGDAGMYAVGTGEAVANKIYQLTGTGWTGEYEGTARSVEDIMAGTTTGTTTGTITGTTTGFNAQDYLIHNFKKQLDENFSSWSHEKQQEYLNSLEQATNLDANSKNIIKNYFYELAYNQPTYEMDKYKNAIPGKDPVQTTPTKPTTIPITTPTTETKIDPLKREIITFDKDYSKIQETPKLTQATMEDRPTYETWTPDVSGRALSAYKSSLKEGEKETLERLGAEANRQGMYRSGLRQGAQVEVQRRNQIAIANFASDLERHAMDYNNEIKKQSFLDFQTVLNQSNLVKQQEYTNIATKIQNNNNVLMQRRKDIMTATTLNNAQKTELLAEVNKQIDRNNILIQQNFQNAMAVEEENRKRLEFAHRQSIENVATELEKIKVLEGLKDKDLDRLAALQASFGQTGKLAPEDYAEVLGGGYSTVFQEAIQSIKVLDEAQSTSLEDYQLNIEPMVFKPEPLSKGFDSFIGDTTLSLDTSLYTDPLGGDVSALDFTL